MNIEKLQKRGAVAQKVTKQEFFHSLVKMCPDCKGAQFTTYVNEDGDRKDKWCPVCFGSGISPKVACFKRAFVWAK